VNESPKEKIIAVVSGKVEELLKPELSNGTIFLSPEKSSLYFDESIRQTRIKELKSELPCDVPNPKLNLISNTANFKMPKDYNHTDPLPHNHPARMQTRKRNKRLK